MKPVCESCQRPLKKEITRQFESYTPGRVVCPHCQAPSRRYISGLDILLYFVFSSLLYSLGLVAVVLMMNRYGTTPAVVVITLVLVAIMYWLMKLCCGWIYRFAFFKAAWKNETIPEEPEKVQRKGKREFWLYMALAFLFATQRALIQYYPLVVLLFLMIMTGQIVYLVKKERQSLEKK